jgi:hypothetical protein
MAWFGESWTGTPAIVVGDEAKTPPAFVLAAGIAIVLPAPITCDGLTVKTWPFCVTTIGAPPVPDPEPVPVPVPEPDPPGTP